MGNTQAAGAKRRGDPPPNSQFGQRASSPASPLAYGQQVPMEPMSRIQDASKAVMDLPFNCPAQPMLVPTAIVWSRGGTHVEVEGSFDNWTTRTPLQRTGNDFTIVKPLPPGVYQYKFVVDGQWQYDPGQPAMYDEMNNVNNVLEVHEFAPENLEGLLGFDPPPSPDSSYCGRGDLCPGTPGGAGAEDFQKEPPVAPPHLNFTLLNVPPALDAQAVLPRPQHVILNHTYVQRESLGFRPLAMGATTRYKSKYITTVFFRAQRSAQPTESSEREMSF